MRQHWTPEEHELCKKLILENPALSIAKLALMMSQIVGRTVTAPSIRRHRIELLGSRQKVRRLTDKQQVVANRIITENMDVSADKLTKMIREAGIDRSRPWVVARRLELKEDPLQLLPTRRTDAQRAKDHIRFMLTVPGYTLQRMQAALENSAIFYSLCHIEAIIREIQNEQKEDSKAISKRNERKTA